MKKINLVIFGLILCLSKSAFSEEKRQGRLLVFGINGFLEPYYLAEKEGISASGLSPASQLSGNVTMGNVAVSTALGLSHLFEPGSFDTNDDFKGEQFVRRATVYLQNVGDSPVSVTAGKLGKKDIAFGIGSLYHPPAFFWRNPVEPLRMGAFGVMGVTGTVDLSEFENLLDEVSFSVFESSSEKDLSIDGEPAFAVRFGKLIETENLDYEVYASFLQKDKSHLSVPTLDADAVDQLLKDRGFDEDVDVEQALAFLNDRLSGGKQKEERVSLGLQVKSPWSDDQVYWLEGVRVRGNHIFKSPKEWILTGGGVIKIAEGTKLSFDASWMNEFASSVATGVWFNLAKGEGHQTDLGFEYRRTDYRDDYNGRFNDSDMFGVLLRTKLYTIKATRLD